MKLFLLSIFSIWLFAEAKSQTGIAVPQMAKSDNLLFTDNTPATTKNYYRLKQADKDGGFTYSNVASLNFSLSGAHHFNVIISGGEELQQRPKEITNTQYFSANNKSHYNYNS